MIVAAYEGPAGSGKTTRLMSRLEEYLCENPILGFQKVLALTFMHGSRKRLDERLSILFRGKKSFEAMTIDSLARYICDRWKDFLFHLGYPLPSAVEYDITCNLAGILLEHSEVCSWLVSKYPVIIIDEAQDLSIERLRIVKALSLHASLLIAADEFQCLKQELRPNPAIDWINQSEAIENLTSIYRTNVIGILNYSSALRLRTPIPSEKQNGLRLICAPVSRYGDYAYPATCAANAIMHRRSGNVAILTPSRSGDYAEKIIKRLKDGTLKCLQSFGPIYIKWEQDEEELIERVIGFINLESINNHDDLVNRITPQLDKSVVFKQILDWLDGRKRKFNETQFSSEIVIETVRKIIRTNSSFGYQNKNLYRAMRITQAKNREFDNVIIIWPYRVGGDDEQKRRLLYNAVTRTRNWCTIIVQDQSILEGAPFR